MKKTKISAILMIGALLSLQVVPANAVTTATNTPILGCVSGVLQGGVCVQQNSISVVPTTSQNVYSCPSGVLIGNSCEIAGGNIKLRPYSQYTHQVQYSWGSNLVCNDPTYSFNESNWPDAY